MLKPTQSLDSINTSMLKSPNGDFLPHLPPISDAHKYLRKHNVSKDIRELKLKDAYHRILNKSENQFQYYQIPYDMQIKHGSRSSLPDNQKLEHEFKSLNNNSYTVNASSVANQKAVSKRFFKRGPDDFFERRVYDNLMKRHQDGNILSELYRKIEVNDTLTDSFNTNIRSSKQLQKNEQKVVVGLDVWKKMFKNPDGKKKNRNKESFNTDDFKDLSRHQLLKLIGLDNYELETRAEENLLNILRKESQLPRDSDFYILSTFFKSKNDLFMDIYDNKIADDQATLTHKNISVNSLNSDIINMQRNTDKVKLESAELLAQIEEKKNLLIQKKRNLKKNEALYTRKAIINQYTGFREKIVTIQDEITEQGNNITKKPDESLENSNNKKSQLKYPSNLMTIQDNIEESQVKTTENIVEGSEKGETVNSKNDKVTENSNLLVANSTTKESEKAKTQRSNTPNLQENKSNASGNQRLNSARTKSKKTDLNNTLESENPEFPEQIEYKVEEEILAPKVEEEILAPKVEVNQSKSLLNIKSESNIKEDTTKDLEGYNAPLNPQDNSVEFDIYENDDEYLKIKTRLNLIINEQEKKDCLSNQYKKDIDIKFAEISKTEKEIANLKKDVKKSQKAQIEFQLKVVKSGNDSRNDGLVWALQKIKKFGGIVTEDHQPDYLDDKSKNFMMKKLRIYEDLLEKESLHSFYWDIFKSFVGEKQGTKQELEDEKFLLANNASTQNVEASIRDMKVSVAYQIDQRKIQQDSYCTQELLSKYEDISRAESKNVSQFYGKSEMSVRGYENRLNSEYKNALMNRNIKSGYRPGYNGAIVNKLSIKEPSVSSIHMPIASNSQVILHSRLKNLGESLDQGFENFRTLPKIRHSCNYPKNYYVENMKQEGVNLQNYAMEIRNEKLPTINEARVMSAKNPIINRNFDVKKVNQDNVDTKVNVESIEKKIVEEDADFDVKNNDGEKSEKYSEFSDNEELDVPKKSESSLSTTKVKLSENPSEKTEKSKKTNTLNSPHENSKNSPKELSNSPEKKSKSKKDQTSDKNRTSNNGTSLQRLSSFSKDKVKDTTIKGSGKNLKESKKIDLKESKKIERKVNRQGTVKQNTNIKLPSKVEIETKSKKAILTQSKNTESTSKDKPNRVLTLKYDKSQPKKTETLSKGKPLKESSKSNSVNKKSETTIVKKTTISSNKSKNNTGSGQRLSILKGSSSNIKKLEKSNSKAEEINTEKTSTQNSNRQVDKQDELKDTDTIKSETLAKEAQDLQTIDENELDFKKKDPMNIENQPRNNRIDSAPAYPVKKKKDDQSELDREGSYLKLPQFDDINISAIAPEYSELYLSQKEISDNYLSYINSKPLYILDQNFKLDSKQEEPSKITNSEKCFRIGNRIMEKMVKKIKSKASERQTDPFQMNILFFDGDTCINDFKSRKEFLQKEIDLEVYIDEKRAEIDVIDAEEIQRIIDAFKIRKANMGSDFGTYMNVLVGYQHTGRIISESRKNPKLSVIFD